MATYRQGRDAQVQYSYSALRPVMASSVETPTAPVSARVQRRLTREETRQSRDMVQFISKSFYTTEEENAVIRVVRIGALHGECSVNWRSEDGSAHKGEKYQAGAGTLVFGPGESVRSFEVQIINDDFFDSNLEFQVVLSDAVNCIIDPAGARSDVMIHDDDMFPSNEWEEVLKKEDEAKLYAIGWGVLWAFIVFCYRHVREIWWKSNLVLLLSMLGNAYYLATIFIRVYLVDTVLDTSHPESSSRLLFPGDPYLTAAALGAAWILPNFILLAADYFQMAVLEMGFNIRYYLRVNLFRKYLHYTAQSRAKVPVQDLKISMMDDIPELVEEGYLILFELWAMLGKIACIAYFMLRKHPESGIPLLVYPLIMAIFLKCTYSKRLDLMAKEGEGQSNTTGAVMNLNTSRRVIQMYGTQSPAVRNFEDILRQQRALTMELKRFQFWNSQLIPWITLLAIGTYMGMSTRVVLTGATSLGSFLATVNVYKDLGDRFSTILKGFTALSKSISPLCGIILQLNYETEKGSYDNFKMREAFALAWMRHMPEGANMDDIPLAFTDATVTHSPSMNTRNKAFHTEARQGSIIQIAGPHDSGKMTLLQLVVGHLIPSSGQVLVSPHLEILYVPHEPLFVQASGIFCNLHMISTLEELKHVDSERGLRILHRLCLDKSWIKEMYESEAESLRAAAAEQPAQAPDPFGCFAPEEQEGEEEAIEDNDEDWTDRLSSSEQWRFQLARAFVANPHVLAINRPVQELDDDMRQTVLSCIQDFVQNRGLELQDDFDITQRRPRTVIFTTGTDVRIGIANYVWRLGETGIVVEKPQVTQTPALPALPAQPTFPPTQLRLSPLPKQSPFGF